MKRRTYLGASGLGGLSALSGCLEPFSAATADEPETADGAVLPPPDQTRGEASHPTYGDEIPSYSVSDALSSEPVSDEDFRGERVQLYTFVYTNCIMGACPGLIRYLIEINEGVRDAGYRDEAAFAPFTFDPKRDTPEILRTYLTDRNVDPSADDWFFLRPETQEAAHELLFERQGGRFGLPIQQAPAEEIAAEGTDPDVEYGFTHFVFILLVNENGIVERSYPGATDRYTPTDIEDDMLAVIEG
ncbi:electron transport protein SCO1/SenC [Halovivax asiaticus JCM 14624]|uniref:Electron transport protein SCO1/SenC n=1 Tax=Halovivax asiaticus JCM 14624 TaxID=1227490 RepID=M0BMC0_9EURY|nr:SCO family protein [Halovivax asiaticus]ELZ10779.1 electron transport protein SCO1/SenC [Halovivax asiaticus JCM 14624]